MNTGPVIEMGPYRVTVVGETAPFTLTLEPLATGCAGLYELSLEFTSAVPAVLPPVRLEWQHPMVDTHLRWLTRIGGAGNIVPWNRASCVSARVTSQAPVYALLSIDDVNRLTFAISDTLNATTLQARLSEEEATLHCAVELEHNSRVRRTSHQVSLRIDTRPLSYAAVLRDVSAWWAAWPGYAPLPVPECARLPMYSTWYSFHLGITPAGIEKQCRLAKEMGMESVIVDDGWQTDDCNRGYAWCGDWEPAPGKFPDFAAHVSRVREMGLKYLLWFSVPFVGVYSKAYERFKDFLLPGRADARWWCLDPRYPEVRRYLVEKYVHFVRDYDIDGLKLDFVDSFAEPSGGDDAGGDGRDNLSVAEAAAALLSSVADALRAVKPDIMLEFRQSYIGPYMRRCGNIFRVGDVPNDFHSNRIHSLDLRLLAGATAVHSDMIMWHPRDSVESAALQLYHTLFAVPQVSVLIDRLPEDHRAMLRTYLRFWRRHRDVLLDGDLLPLQPGMGYPLAIARNGQKFLAAAYAPVPIELPPDPPPTILLVNGAMTPKLWVAAKKRNQDAWQLQVTDCLGRTRNEKDSYRLKAHQELEVPPGGCIRLQHH